MSIAVINDDNNNIFNLFEGNYYGIFNFNISKDKTIIILYQNIADSLGDDIYIYDCDSSKKVFNNMFGEIIGNLGFSAGNNIDVDPLFFDIKNEDFRLKPDLPCINKGNNEAKELPDYDMDGNPRIADGIVDIGAYEHSTTELHPADSNQNWNIEANEFEKYNSYWKQGLKWTIVPESIPVDYVTKAAFLMQSSGKYTNTGAGEPACWVPVND